MVKRVSGLWPKITSFDNVYQAYKKARLGKADRQSVAGFSLNLESELLAIQRELVNGSYQPSEYQQFYIKDKKPRLISAAAFRDRVAQHALMTFVEPEIDKRLITHCYACRVGKGVHRAVDSYQQAAQRYPYVLKLDIKAYFHSIQHDVLKRQLKRVFKEPPLLDVLFRIIDSSPNNHNGVGLPIGNLSSQIFANLYLNDIDHRMLANKRIGHYLRYVDDLYLLADCKHVLWAVKAQLDSQLGDIGLAIHPDKQQLLHTGRAVEIFGFRVSATKRWLCDANGHRAARRYRALMNAYGKGQVSFGEAKQSLAAWQGHACHAETIGLRRQLLQRWVLSRSR